MMNNSAYITQQMLMHAVWHERKIKQASKPGKDIQWLNIRIAKDNNNEAITPLTGNVNTEYRQRGPNYLTSGEGSEDWKNRIIANIWKDWHAYCFLLKSNGGMSTALQAAMASCYPLPWAASSTTGAAWKQPQQKGTYSKSVEDRESENVVIQPRLTLFKTLGSLILSKPS